MNNNPKKKKPLNKYIRFTGIAFQLGIIMYLAAYFGKMLDARYGNDKNLFTLALSLLGLIAAIYLIVKQLKESEKE